MKVKESSLIIIDNDLKQVRKRRGFTRKELADELNCHPRMVKEYEEFERLPTIKMQNRINEFFKVNIDWEKHYCYAWFLMTMGIIKYGSYDEASKITQRLINFLKTFQNDLEEEVGDLSRISFDDQKRKFFRVAGAETLKMARIQRNLSQTELAYIAGVSQVTLSHIENAKVQPYPSTKEKIEQVLGAIDWERTFQEPVQNLDRTKYE